MNTKKNKTMGFNPLDELSEQSVHSIKQGMPLSSEPALRSAKHHAQEHLVQEPSAASPETNAQNRETVPESQGAKDVEMLFAAELSLPEESIAAKTPNTLSPSAVRIVKKWSQWSVAGGFVPLPVVDSLLISGAQVAMIRELCIHYDVPFKKKVAIAVASGLLGGAATTTVAQVATRTVVRSMPIIGTLFTLTAEPALSYATTYGIGHAFIKHFEADGTLETFNPTEMKQSLAEHIQQGKHAFNRMAGK